MANGYTKSDEFSEKFQRGEGGFSIQKFMLQILDPETGLLEHDIEEKSAI